MGALECRPHHASTMASARHSEQHAVEDDDPEQDARLDEVAEQPAPVATGCDDRRDDGDDDRREEEQARERAARSGAGRCRGRGTTGYAARVRDERHDRSVGSAGSVGSGSRRAAAPGRLGRDRGRCGIGGDRLDGRRIGGLGGRVGRGGGLAVFGRPGVDRARLGRIRFGRGVVLIHRLQGRRVTRRRDASCPASDGHRDRSTGRRRGRGYPLLVANGAQAPAIGARANQAGTRRQPVNQETRPMWPGLEVGVLVAGTGFEPVTFGL